jgi:hypothetical protein
MEIIYIDSSCISKDTSKISLSEFEKFIINLHNFNKIGIGTYCMTYKISKEYVIKYYPYSNNFDIECGDYIPEIKNEIKFIKKYNYLPYIATSFIVSIYNQDIYILQEYLKIPQILNNSINDFKYTINYFIELLRINIDLLKYNYLNIDIKHTNIGYDNQNNLKIFDFNLFFEITNLQKKISLYNKFDYYYLHPVIPFTTKNIISYSVAILILESFSNNSECRKFLYEPTKKRFSKFILLKLKQSTLTPFLYKLLHLCFTDKYTPEYLYNDLKLYSNIRENKI